MTEIRTESDLLGLREIPAQALSGIHTLRAVENFPLTGRRVDPRLIQAFGLVKQAAAMTNRELGFLQEDVAPAIIQACEELARGEHQAEILVDALQGGAGTSTNMNVNELLTNRALLLMGELPGNYERIDPLRHLNLHQSTNDTYPTALRIAAIRGVRNLERQVVRLVESFQHQEKAMARVVKVGRTQMQDAVLTTLGREMGSYAEAFSRDRWRIDRCEERLRVVNLGGTAIGTGLAAPRQYIFRVTEHLRLLTGLGLARAENLVEATQNQDVFVEVSGILKTLASNLLKVCGDLRLMSSGPDAGFGEITLPERAAGSSIMPGKVNPVIPEAVMQCAMKVVGNDVALTMACSMGSLELNAFMPLIADLLLESMSLLTEACTILRCFCIDGLKARPERCLSFVHSSTASLTALVEELGYEMASRLGAEAKESGLDLRTLILERRLLTAERFDQLVSADSVMRLGSVSSRSMQPPSLLSDSRQSTRGEDDAECT